MTKLAKEATRPSDRKIVEALEWVAANEGRVAFPTGTIAVTVGDYHLVASDMTGFVEIVDIIREAAKTGKGIQ